ncbi:LacI family DNA-binding transcriptional regulator [Pontiellaceae bacterium B1224]|nr:LacI family DNA-binding transcriptional regulator [Pontiellaceae bacterium B1224]
MKDGSEKRRITLADIAKACGVSSMTVSLALRKNPKISEKTRTLVKQKAEELGYVPDPMLSALNQYRGSTQEKPVQATLAWINPYHDPKRLRAMCEFNLYWEGASSAAKEMGYHLEAFATTKMSFSRMNSIFKTRNIQGILLAALCRPQFSDKNADFTEMPWEDYAIVRFGRSTAYPEAHYVTSAQTSNTILAFEKILEKGYQRIGFVTEYRPMRTFSGGVTIAQQALPEHQRLPILLFTLGENKESRIQRLKQWIAEEKPDVIFTDEEKMPEFMSMLNIRIPDDIGLVTTSIHDTPIDAGIDQNPEEVGRTAVRTLVSLINHQSFGIPSIRNEILVDGRWVDGSMLPPRH